MRRGEVQVTNKVTKYQSILCQFSIIENKVEELSDPEISKLAKQFSDLVTKKLSSITQSMRSSKITTYFKPNSEPDTSTPTGENITSLFKTNEPSTSSTTCLKTTSNFDYSGDIIHTDMNIDIENNCNDSPLNSPMIHSPIISDDDSFGGF